MLNYDNLITPQSGLYTAFNHTKYKKHFANKQKAISYTNQMLRLYAQYNEQTVKDCGELLQFNPKVNLKDVISCLTNISNYNSLVEFMPRMALIHMTKCISYNQAICISTTTTKKYSDEMDLLCFRTESDKKSR